MNRTISNSLQLFVALFLLLNLAHSQNYDLNNSLTLVWPARNMTKPNYLQDVVDPTLGTTLTRIARDVSATIENIQSETQRNFINNGKNVEVSAIRNLENRLVVFRPDIVNQAKGTDRVISEIPV